MDIAIIFDGPPEHRSGRFVEVEDNAGRSINIGEWIERDDGYWELRIPGVDAPSPLNKVRGAIAVSVGSLPRPEGVRCGDCKFYNTLGSCTHVKHQFKVDEDDWCANPCRFVDCLNTNQ